MRFRPRITLPVVLAAVFGFGFGASAFLNIAQHQRAEQERKLMQGEIVDLRYQIQQDKLNADRATATVTPSPSSSPDIPADSPSPTPSPSASPGVLGDSSTPAPTPQTKTVKAACNMRTDASETSARIMRVAGGAVATLGAEARNGYQQVTINGKTGYVLASYLQ